MPDEELDQEGLSESEAAMLAEYEAEDEISEGEATEKVDPEAPTEVVQAETQEKPETFRVPLHELKEERAKRQEAERKLDLLAQRTDTLLSQIQQVTTPAPEQPPDRYEDPVGYLQWQNDQLLARTTENQTRAQQYVAQQEQERAAQTFLNDYNQTIQEFAQRTPDYKEATEFLADARRRELESLGFTPDQINSALWQDSLTIAAHAKSQGKNHAEIFYNLAKQRGYQGGQQQASVKPTPATKQNLDNVRRGTQAATSLSNMGGSGEEELSAEALINMSDEEFAAATSGKKWNRLHGK